MTEAEPAAEAEPGPTAEAGPEPAAGAGPEPAAGAGPEPAAGAGPEPAAGAGPEPAAEAGEHRPLALVTGGLQRLGAAIAARLAYGGYALALHRHRSVTPARVLAEALAATGVPAQVFQADLLSPAQTAQLIARVGAHFGRPPDVLVNNAAAFTPGAWEDLSHDDLTRMMQVNYYAPVMLAKALVAASHRDVLPRDVLPRDLQSVIINILDQRVANPVPDQLAYSLSKQALWQATRTLAVALGPRARVNAVAPGLTIITEAYAPGQAERLARRMPLGRLPEPADVAEAVFYLTQARAMTGQTLFVDGGANLVAMERDFVYLEREASRNKNHE